MRAHHNERELADFIRHGAERRPHAGFGLVHLNDDHRWSREQIATWLESVNTVDKPLV